MSEWVETTLGEVLTLTKRPVLVSEVEEVPWAGARWYAEGIYARSVETAAKVKTKTLNRLKAGDVTYNRMWATKAAFGVVGEEADGCLVTNDFPIFVAESERVHPAYIEALFKTSAFQAEAASRAVGTTERRRLKEPDFLGIPISLPPLAEQRRIVDVMAAVDAQIGALEADLEASERVYKAMLASWIVNYEGTPVADVILDAYAGATPSRTKPHYYGGRIPWLKSGEVEQDCITTTVESITEDGLRGSSTKIVPAGATVLAISGQGDTKGRAGYLGSPMTTNQHVLALIPDPAKIKERYLLHAIRSQTNALRSGATGTTRPGITKAQVLSHEIPLPVGEGEQERVTAAADALTEQVETARRELTTLRTFRSTLLTALLSQQIEIPESYDSLLEVAS